MFGRYFQQQLEKQSKRLNKKEKVYQIFLIPVDKIANDPPLTKRIKQQCQKLRSEFSFIRHEIVRLNHKKKRGQNILYGNWQRNSTGKFVNSAAFGKSGKEELENKRLKYNKSEMKEDNEMNKMQQMKYPFFVSNRRVVKQVGGKNC